MEDKLQDLLDNFTTEFHKNYKAAILSGAIDTETATPIEIGRCVLVITAESFAPMSPVNKKMLTNLRHFI